MYLGKNAEAHYACFRTWRSARRLGHRGIVVRASLFDGALHKPMSRYIGAHERIEARLASTGPAEEAALTLRTWRIDVLCVNHVAHRGCKWALYFFLDDKDALKDVWVVIESLSNSFTSLVNHVAPFLETSLGPEAVIGILQVALCVCVCA